MRTIFHWICPVGAEYVEEGRDCHFFAAERSAHAISPPPAPSADSVCMTKLEEPVSKGVSFPGRIGARRTTDAGLMPYVDQIDNVAALSRTKREEDWRHAGHRNP